ncbi:HlyD family efflux transporter periplasmic adaptor subunit [candidate division KSB1 bacterium]|nr:HlyD family efflux transporter periplasmic adaptor subunit [candidate division KSB1 bacterium]
MKARNLILLHLLILGCHSSSRIEAPVYTVKKGEFVVSVIETGELKAIKSTEILAPYISWRFGELKITWLVPDGTEVEKGDTLIHFDEAEVQKGIIDAEAELEMAKTEYEKLKIEQLAEIEELKADFKLAGIAYQMIQIELQQATYEAEIRKREIQIRLNQTKMDLKKAEEEIANRELVNKEELRKQQLRIDQLSDALEDAYTTLKNMTVTAPGPGVVIIEKNASTDIKWQVGDQPWDGQTIMTLPDLNEMKAIAEINELDISKIHPDQGALIRLDVLPDTAFSGRVTEIALLARDKDEKSGIKIFPIEITINGSHAYLLPGMTVRCEIVVDKFDSVIRIPLEALFERQGKNIVYIEDGGNFVPAEVSVGAENSDFIIIKNGLTEGDRIALVDPTQLN